MSGKQINEYLRILTLNYCGTGNLHQVSQRNVRIIFLDGAKLMEQWELTCMLNSLETMFYKAEVFEDSLGKMIRVQFKKD